MSYNNFIHKKWQNIFNIYFFGEPLFWLALYGRGGGGQGGGGGWRLEGFSLWGKYLIVWQHL